MNEPTVASISQEGMKAWAFEQTSNAMLITNTKHKILTVNKTFLEWFNYNEEEVLGCHAGVLLHSRSLGPELGMQIPESLETSGTWQGEVINQSKSGFKRPCLLSISSIFSPEGEKIGYLGVYIDLTDRKRLEEQIMQGEKLSNIGESVATLMHEVRSPLSGISMNAFMLEASALKDKPWSNGDLESIHLISREVKRLEILVKNALSYARDMQISQETTNLGEFFDQVKTLVVQQAQKHLVGIHLKPLSDDLAGFIDPHLMNQVLTNLLQNAIEAAAHSLERVVRLGARIDENPKWRYISSSAKVLLINVDNSGDQISEEVIRNLFKPFFTSKAEGIGLGLAIASKIVRQHHGILGHYNINDQPYTTRFTIALPI